MDVIIKRIGMYMDVIIIRIGMYMDVIIMRIEMCCAGFPSVIPRDWQLWTTSNEVTHCGLPSIVTFLDFKIKNGKD